MHDKSTIAFLHAALLDEMIFQARALAYELKQLEKAGFNPDQPRAPRGQPDGGQWIDTGQAATHMPPPKPPYDPPIEPVYPELTIIPILRVGRLATAWQEWLAIRKVSKNWQLSPTKSKIKWRNRIEKGNWTPQKITNTIRYGNRFRVKNERTGGSATRYEYEDSYVVRDDATGDILQVSRPNHIPKNFK